MDTVLTLRQGSWPGGYKLTEMEKNLISVLMETEPNRPFDLSQVIEVVDYIIEEEKGRNILE